MNALASLRVRMGKGVPDLYGNVHRAVATFLEVAKWVNDDEAL